MVDCLGPLPQINPVPLADSVRVRQEHSRAPVVAYLDRRKLSRALQEVASLDPMRHRSCSNNRLGEACSDLQRSRNPRQVVSLVAL